MARLLKLSDQAPGFVAFLSGPKHTFQMVNAAFLRLTGQRELIGHPLNLALPELRGQGYIELVDTVAASGEPHLANGMRMALRRADGSTDELFIDVLFQPDIDSDGNVTGIYIQGTKRHRTDAGPAAGRAPPRTPRSAGARAFQVAGNTPRPR